MPPVPFSLRGLKGKEDYTFGWAREASRTGKFVWSHTANMVVFVLGTSTHGWIMQKKINILLAILGSSSSIPNSLVPGRQLYSLQWAEGWEMTPIFDHKHGKSPCQLYVSHIWLFLSQASCKWRLKHLWTSILRNWTPKQTGFSKHMPRTQVTTYWDSVLSKTLIKHISLADFKRTHQKDHKITGYFSKV